MTTAAIRDMISRAKVYEQQQDHLAAMLERQLNTAAKDRILINDKEPLAILVQFVTAYIERVPCFIEHARNICVEAGIQDHAAPFLALAEQYFLESKLSKSEKVGLYELLYEAYVAHRLMEEVNDRFMAHGSLPLIPEDITNSNLIIHTLIGEPFANELDEAVNYTLDKTREKEYVYDSETFKSYIAQQKQTEQQVGSSGWSPLTEQLLIDIKISGFALQR